MGKRVGERLSYFKTIIVWLAIVLLGCFYLSIRETYDPVNITAMPQVPRYGEPILVTFQLNNPGLKTLVTKYRFFADGVLLKEGEAAISPLSSKTYQYAYSSPVEIGQRVSFAVKTRSGGDSYEKIVSAPPFPPQVASSFISFASFSTTVMSSMATLTFYQTNYNAGSGFNAGVLMSICLILLLIFLELAGAAIEEKSGPSGNSNGVVILQRFRIRFSTLTGILFIIFMGIVYTKVIMILSTA